MTVQKRKQGITSFLWMGTPSLFRPLPLPCPLHEFFFDPLLIYFPPSLPVSLCLTALFFHHPLAFHERQVPTQSSKPCCLLERGEDRCWCVCKEKLGDTITERDQHLAVRRGWWRRLHHQCDLSRCWVLWANWWERSLQSMVEGDLGEQCKPPLACSPISWPSTWEHRVLLSL